VSLLVQLGRAGCLINSKASYSVLYCPNRLEIVNESLEKNITAALHNMHLDLHTQQTLSHAKHVANHAYMYM